MSAFGGKADIECKPREPRRPKGRRCDAARVHHRRRILREL